MSLSSPQFLFETLQSSKCNSSYSTYDVHYSPYNQSTKAMIRKQRADCLSGTTSTNLEMNVIFHCCNTVENWSTNSSVSTEINAMKDRLEWLLDFKGLYSSHVDAQNNYSWVIYQIRSRRCLPDSRVGFYIFIQPKSFKSVFFWSPTNVYHTPDDLVEYTWLPLLQLQHNSYTVNNSRKSVDKKACPVQHDHAIHQNW